MQRDWTTSARYNGVARALHWTIAVLFIGNLLGGFFHDAFGDAKATVMSLHKATGILILLLSLFRIVWRLMHRPPPLPASISPLQQRLAGVGHFLLYAASIAMPLTGWMMVSAGAKYPISFYGLFNWPFLPIKGNEALGEIGHEGHEIGGFLLAALVVGHVVAALHHHFVNKNGLINRMR